MKKIPMRRCVGCGADKPKKELVRVVRDKEHNLSVDATGKKPGRGAYLCKDTRCLEKAERKNSLGSSLKMQVPPALYQQLLQQLKEV